MLWKSCIVDSSAESACTKVFLLKDVPTDDESYVKAKRGIPSFVHCSGIKFSKPEAEKLDFTLGRQYLSWFAIHFFIMLALVSISLSDAAMNATGSTLGLIILNGMASSSIAILAVTKHLKLL
ncbi:hypothetical protein GGF38_004409, partial [Coemansia sp. RSA 25]